MILRDALRRLARLLLDWTEPPAPERPNRANLLREDARREGDACYAFVPGTPGGGGCETDGHYLCDECGEMSRQEWRRRRDLPEDENEDVGPRGRLDGEPGHMRGAE